MIRTEAVTEITLHFCESDELRCREWHYGKRRIVVQDCVKVAVSLVQSLIGRGCRISPKSVLTLNTFF